MSNGTKSFKFINPYNFIPMGKNVSKYKYSQDEEKLSGVIEYSILTKTPIFIPNTSGSEIFKNDGDDAEHKTYDFFSYTNLAGKRHGENEYYMPVIPGSEIRGMFRNNFEILTNSCMSSLDSDMKLSKRTLESFNAGLFRRVIGADGEVSYDLFEAEDILWRTKGENNTETDLKWDNTKNKRRCYIQSEYKEGEPVYFEEKKRLKNNRPIKSLADNVKKVTGKMSAKGYIIKGENGPKKHCCHIFKKRSTIPKYKKVKISLLDELLDVYASNTLENASKYEEYSRELKKFKAGEGSEYFPVYYSEVTEPKRKGKLFLSPSCKAREIYDNTLKVLAKSFEPCTKESGYCEACALFGTVDESDSISSRIRFSDLTIEEGEGTAKDFYFTNPVTLPEMSSPKLNNMEFYLKRPEGAMFWTYDYYVDINGTIHVMDGELNGRKFYWHQHIDDSFNPKQQRIKRNVTIRPLKTNKKFQGKLFFKDISKDELNKLICIINTMEDETVPIEEKKYGYKIGMGKPLGLGSIASHVDNVKIKKYIIENGMAKLRNDDYAGYELSEVKKKFDGDTMTGFQKMTGFDSISLKSGEKFSYPKNKEEDKGYDWYVGNHRGINRIRNEIVGMPNSRKDMLFMEYMEALDPRVKSVKKKKTDSTEKSIDDLKNSSDKQKIIQKQENRNIVKKDVKKAEEVVAEFKEVQGKKIKFDTNGAGYPQIAWKEIEKVEKDINKDNFKEYFKGCKVILKCKDIVDGRPVYEYIRKAK